MFNKEMYKNAKGDTDFIYYFEPKALKFFAEDFEEYLGTSIIDYMVNNGLKETNEKVKDYSSSLHYDIMDDDILENFSASEVERAIEEQLKLIIFFKYLHIDE